MKVNTSRSKAKGNMRRNGQKKNRPEQLLAAQLIKTHLPTYAIVDTEEMVSVSDPDVLGAKKDISVDITVRLGKTQIAVELNGPPHDELPQIRRDRRKQIILEWPGNDWKYVVFDYNKMETLFLRNERMLDYDEIVKAYGEILTIIGSLLPLQEANKNVIDNILRKS